MTKERVLIVDDEADFGKFVGHVAKSLGFEIAVISQPRDFKDTYATFDPTVIVLDIVMPEIDGIELVRWLTTVGTKARIVIISGYSPTYARAAETLGEVAGLANIIRLPKPVVLAQLSAALLGKEVPPSIPA